MNSIDVKLKESPSLSELSNADAEFHPVLGDKQYLAFVNEGGQPKAYHRIAETNQYKRCTNINTKEDLKSRIN